MTVAIATPKGGSAPPVRTKSSATVSFTIMAGGMIAIVAGAIYLLKTNPSGGLWKQGYDPTGHWWLSTVFAAVPVAVLLGAMAILRLKAHTAAVIGW